MSLNVCLTIKSLTLRQSLHPFSVITAQTGLEEEVRERRFPWGTINIDDAAICDTMKLEEVLFRYSNSYLFCRLTTERSHTQELKDNTSDTLYEEYRTQYLSRQEQE